MFIQLISVLDRFNERMTRLLGYMATAALFAMLGIIVANVFLRYGVGESLHWAEEMSRFLMAWMAFLFFPMGHKKHMNVKVDFAVSWFAHRKIGQLLHFLLEAIVFICVLFFAQLTWGMVLRAGNMEELSLMQIGISLLDPIALRSTTTSSALSVPMCYVYLVMPLSFLMVGLCSLENLLRLLLRVLGMSEQLASPDQSSSTPVCDDELPLEQQA